MEILYKHSENASTICKCLHCNNSDINVQVQKNY